MNFNKSSKLAVALIAGFAGLSSQAQTTFNVDMQCVSDFQEVFVTGPFCGWCANEGYNQALDTDGDGIYTVAIADLVGDVEYKYAIDGFTGQENLVNDMVDGATCAPITDFSGYANRLTPAGSTSNDTYGSCDGVCNDQPTHAVTFQVDMNNYVGAYTTVNLNGSFNGWCGGCAAMTDDDGDGIYALTIGGLELGGIYEYKFTLDGWNAQENFEPGDACTSTIDGFTNRTLTISGDETLPAVCYDSCDACVAVAETVNVTFQVNMAETPVNPVGVFMGGNIQGWNPGGTQLADPDGDGIYSVTLEVPANAEALYKFCNGPGWEYAESVPPTCGVSGDLNRSFMVGATDVVIDPVCFSGCLDCGQSAATTSVTLEVDMSQQEVSADGVHVAGSFQGWAPGDTELMDEDGDGIYAVTLELEPFTYEYKFVNGNAWGSDEAVPSACNVNGNRSLVVGDQDITVRYCYEQCTSECTLPTPGADITFSVDANNLDTVSSGGIYLMSSFTDPQWQGGAIAMNDDDGDGVWTTTVFVDGAAEIQYKYNNGDPFAGGVANSDGEETFDFETAGCGAPNGVGGFNRTLVRTGEAQVLDVVCFDSCTACQDLGAGTTFTVDMSCAPAFDNVFVTGPWCAWCANDVFNTMTDPDGDGVYEVTVYDLTGTVEYKFAINGFADQENLINDMADLGATCAPITDYASYANRTTEAGSTTTDYYGTCDGTCNDEVVSSSSAITFQVDMSQYTGAYNTVNLNGSFNGWCGSCATMTDDDEDGVYELTVDLTPGTIEYKFTLNGWDFQEEFAGGESCTSTIDGFTNRSYDVAGDATIPVVCWNSCDACPDVTAGCTDETAANYNPNSTVDDGSCYYNPGCQDPTAQNYDATADADDNSCQYLVTFRINMSNETVAAEGVHIAGSFQGWDPGATAVPMLGYSVYELTIALSNGTYEYKFVNGNMWGQDESVGECGNGGNRVVVVDGADITTGAPCFNSCDACQGCTDPFSLEFDPFAGEDDGSCLTSIVEGCTYQGAENFMPSANVEDGSCIFQTASSCPGDLDGDGTVATPDLLSFLSVFGTDCN
jgi:1,4-alpha-glucan branching enzyme